MRKLLILSLVILIILCACTAKTSEKLPEVQTTAPGSMQTAGEAGDEVLLTFEGAVAGQMTRKEFLELEQMSVELTRTNSKGKTTTGVYTGVHWNVLAKAIGAQDAQSVKAVASDGFEQAYPLNVLTAQDSLFALYKDGEPITEERENGQVWFCSSEEFTANYWTKFIVKFVVK